jgi:hypothetical protein
MSKKGEADDKGSFQITILKPPTAVSVRLEAYLCPQI